MIAKATKDFETVEKSSTWLTDAANISKILALETVYNYQFDNQSEVTGYLIHNPELIPMLEAIPEKVLSYLPDSKLFLNVETDPEIADDISFYVWVIPNDEPKEAYKKLKAFKREWWLANSSSVRGKLFVALDYR
jgi:hypothetical protein